MDNQYFFARNKQRFGPFTLDQLREQEVTPATLVWRRGMTAWTKAGELPELAPLFAPEEPAEEPVEEPEFSEISENSENSENSEISEISENSEGSEGSEDSESSEDSENSESSDDDEDFDDEDFDEDADEDFDDEDFDEEEDFDADEDLDADEDFDDDEEDEEEPEPDDELEEEADEEVEEPVAAAPPVHNAPKPKPVSNAGSSKKLYFIGAGVAVVLLLVGFLIFRSCKSTPRYYDPNEDVEPIETVDAVDSLAQEDSLVVPEIPALNEKPETTPVAVEEVAVKDTKPGKQTEPLEKTETEKPSKGTKMRFMGTINGQYEVRGTLYADGENLTGSYAYIATINKYGDIPSAYIRLKGKIKPTGYFRVYGTSKLSKHVEQWQGHIKDGMISAITTGADGSPLELDASIY